MGATVVGLCWGKMGPFPGLRGCPSASPAQKLSSALFFWGGGVQSEVSAKQQELPVSAASGSCREHPRGRALTFSSWTRLVTLGLSLG